MTSDVLFDGTHGNPFVFHEFKAITILGIPLTLEFALFVQLRLGSNDRLLTISLHVELNGQPFLGWHDSREVGSLPSSLTMTAVHFPSFLETVSRAFLESNSSIVAVVVQTPEKSATFGESAAFIHGVAMQSPSEGKALCFMVNLTKGFKRTSPVKTDKFSAADL